MKIIKNINNNVSVCEDKNGNQLVAFGKGIGFLKPNTEIPLNKIEKTFYSIDNNSLYLFNEINKEIIDLSYDIVSYARKIINSTLLDSITLVLADHISFAIERNNKGIPVSYPISYEA